MVGFECVFRDRASTFGVILALISRLNKLPIEDPAELAYYLAYGPKETPISELIRIEGRRWQVEDCFETAKGEVGIDEY